MKSFIDVHPGDWYYSEVIEATNYQMQDGSLFVAGIPYNSYQSGKVRVYIELRAAAGQQEFNLGQTITVSAENPLFVYVDGVQTVYKGIKSGGTLGLTGNTVVLYASPGAGATLSFYQPGVVAFSPVNNEEEGQPSVNGNPKYPRKPLQDGDTYYYDPQHMKANEYCYAFGRALRRAIIPDREWRQVTGDTELENLLKKYIGYKDDVYVVSPNSSSIFPYASGLADLAVTFDPTVYGDHKIRSWVFAPYALSGVTMRIEYCVHTANGQWLVKGGNFQVFSPTGVIVMNDRFFPKGSVTRAEAVVWLNRLRISFYQRFTDIEPATKREDNDYVALDETYSAYQCQTLFSLSNHYVVGDDSLRVYKNGSSLASRSYEEVDSTTVRLDEECNQGDKIRFYAERGESRFTDISSSAWYFWSVMEIEMETFGDGDYLIVGVGNDRLDPNKKLSRAETVVLLNRFRKWAIERFKL